MILKESLEVIRNTVKDISTISTTAYVGSDGLFDSATVLAYRKQLEGLSRTQAETSLTVAGLTNAQRNQVLSTLEVTAATKQLTAGQIEERISTKLNSVEDAKAITQKLIKAGIISTESGAINTLTIDTLEQAAANGVLSASEFSATASALGFTTANITLSSSFKILTASALASIKAIGTFLFTTPAGWVTLVTGAVVGAVAIFNHFYDTVDETKEKVEELTSVYKEATDTANKNLKTVEGLANRYKKLSEGVDNLGRNISLTEDEFVEYNDIVNQIADMSPELVKGWTNEGNAILSVKGNVDELIDSYKEAQKEAYNTLIVTGKDGNGNDILKNYKDVLSGRDIIPGKGYVIGETLGNKPVIDLLKKFKEVTSVEEFKKVWHDASSGTNQEFWMHKDWQNVLAKTGLKKLLNKKDLTVDDIYNVRGSIDATIQTLQAEIDTALSNTKSLANAYLMTNKDYEKLDEETKNIASILVNSLDENIASTFEDKDDVGAWVNKIIEALNSEDKDVQKAFSDLFSIDFSEMTPDEAKAQIDSLIKTIANVLDEDPLTLKVRLGFDNYDDLADNYETITNKAIEKFTGLNQYNINSADDYKRFQEEKQALKDFAKENSINTQDEIAFWNQCIKESQTKEEAMKKYLDSSYVKKDKIDLANIPDTITKLDSQLKPAFDSLKTAYQDIFTEDGFTLENVDIDTFSGIQKAIDTFNELDGVTKISQETYEEFVKVISDSTSTADDVHNVFNKLATDFVNNTNVVYADADAMNALKQSLEQMGVINAEEVLNDIKSAQQEIIDAGYDLENMTNDEATAFLRLSDASYTAKHYLINYLLTKQLAEHPLNTHEDITALEDLCTALNITGNLFAEVEYLKNLEMSAGIPPEYKDKLISQAKQRIQDALKEYYTVDFGFEFDGSNDENDNASKAAEKAASDLLDKLLALYEAELNNGLITFDEFVQKSKDTIEQFYKEGKIKAEDYWNYIHNLYEKQISYMDKVISAVTSKIDDEIDSLEKKKESIEEIYNKQIKSIQEEIDILEKANQKRKDAIDLQKALYALRRAENQRTNLVYSMPNSTEM